MSRSALACIVIKMNHPTECITFHFKHNEPVFKNFDVSFFLCSVVLHHRHVQLRLQLQADQEDQIHHRLPVALKIRQFQGFILLFFYSISFEGGIVIKYEGPL